MREIKFNLITYSPIRVYSKDKNSYFIARETDQIARLDPNTPAPAENLDIEEILKRLPKGVEKSKRSCVQLFDIDTFALKEYVDMNKWNGCIFIDLDIYHSDIINGKPNIEETLDFLYDRIINVLIETNDCFYYAERSSSGGFHFLFNYKVEPTRTNFDKCAKHTREMIYAAGNEFIEWKQILDSEGVFDSIYTRPYQRVFITGIDAVVNYNHTGEISQEMLDSIEVIDRQAIKDANAKKIYQLVSFNPDGEYVTNHNERFYIYTALKRITPDEKTCNAYYHALCDHFATYKSYTKDDFKKEFSYAQIDESTAHVHKLKKYGIRVNENVLHYHLDDNEYMSNVINDILEQTENGINLLLAPTGVGKNQTWINYNKEMLADPLSASNKPILMIEPLNSIIETKYDSDVCVVTGSKTFPKIMAGYAMYVTNYNKVLVKTPENGWKLKENLAQWFSQFEMVIIDESHIIIKDSFRADVLTEFVKTINEASKHTKIILQTATPMDEKELFNINKTFVIHKEPKRKAKMIFRRFNSTPENTKFRIQEVICLCNYYMERGRKVYIYWNNASLQILNSFKATCEHPERVAIFHKRNTGEDDMKYISEEHELGENYDILLTSVYFGVGNDLNDKCDAAVIIIGNNTWQEDLQVIGRWRNSPNVEICEIITDDNEYKFVENTAIITGNRNVELCKWEKQYTSIWCDKRNRDKSIIINKKSYSLKSKEDIHILAVMRSSEVYHSGFNVKVEMLSNPYYNIRMKTDYTRPLECNAEYMEQVRDFNKSVKNVRNEQKAKIMLGTPDWKVINKDTKLERFAKIWPKLKTFGVDKILSAKEISANSNYNMLDLWLRYYKSLISENTDCAEIYALLWFRDKLHLKTSEEIEQMKMNVGEYIDVYEGVNDVYKLNEYDQYVIYAYIIWLWYRNNGENTNQIVGNYYSTFKFNCEQFLRMPNGLVAKIEEHLDDVNPNKKNPYTETDDFFNEVFKTTTTGTEIKHWVDINKLISCIDPDRRKEKNWHSEIVKCLRYKYGGRPYGVYKPVKINGVEYRSSQEAQVVLGKSAAWVSIHKEKTE